MKKFQIFDQTHGLTFWKNENFATFLNRCFYGQERLVFYLELYQTLFKAKCGLKETINQFQVFDQNYELTALEKFRFFDIDVSMVKKG